MNDQKNLIVAVGLAVVILVIYQIFVLGPQSDQRRAALEAERSAASESAPTVSADEIPSGPAAMRSVEEVRADSERVAIDTPSLRGSLSLSGARIDDLYLKNHYNTVDAKEEQDASEQVELLVPRGADHAFYTYLGWATVEGGPQGLPGLDTPWRLVEGETLTPQTPVTLEYESGGLSFQRVISVDENYMFTVQQRVTNNSGSAVVLSPYGQVRRHGLPANFAPFYILFEGGIGSVGGELKEKKYQKLADGTTVAGKGQNGWVGITDKYWLAAVIPPQGETFDLELDAISPAGSDIFESSYRIQAFSLAPGQSRDVTSRIFTGAKEYDILNEYQGQGVDRFVWAIDWGNFWFLTRPFFWSIDNIYDLVGNFGVAILIFVVLIKLIMLFPANKAYASMARMKALQPKMKELQERYKDDRQKLSQEMMAMYRREKVNPAGGCLPMLIQIPIFYALYKTIFVTIEMRHAPFFGWIRDLSAPDPTQIGNLFGLLPYDASAIPLIGGPILSIGIWPIIMGLTMWGVQSLNPPPGDKMQARIFAMMPIIFTFILARFAAGLVIYWAWNNLLTLIQQYFIMRRHGVETQADKLLARLRGRKAENEG
ncbi:MAG: membrane protein insertase YidC [Euryhalocaulis sp.]|uniref:membrane protein insertase YidC n=1 Tax=Euryhalocaulis sp. TaxID=2744307 RepID=UPI0018194F7A|nr:membrane protein insertase YidC [Euryhalocaulis sp.]MBA4801647.1 membrane protein insertase YidC [Euryhalocaulis sp.]